MDEKVWDAGPQPPARPVKPQVLLDAVDLPPGAEGDPQVAPELARYSARYANYLLELDRYPAERQAWEAKNGKGPIEVAVNSAAETIERDAQRYSIRRPLHDG